MTRYADLVKVALLGRGRKQAPPDDGPFGGLDLAARLAAAALCDKAGRLPARIDAGGTRAPEHDLPRASAAASRALATILAAFPEVLPEWLDRCRAAGRRVRERDLPALLELARTTPRLRPAVAGVLGGRGRWLTGENPAWAFAAEADAADWETGARAARAALLRRRRAEDPAAALALLESTFSADGGEDRAAFVAALEVGLSPADEAFLERALDDRRKEVRRAAAALLTRLPGSRLARRMDERLRACLHGARVVFPAACDDAMIRDGIEPVPPKGVGAKAFWLFQIVAAVPPAGLPWDKLLRGEHAPLFLAAGSRAALVHADADAAERFLRRAAAGDEGADPELVEVLPAARRHALLEELVDNREPEALALVLRAPPTLSPGLSRAAVRAASRAPYRGRILAELARRIDPHVDPDLHPILADQLPVLELRARIHRELPSPSSS
ncbi:MAG TPA: DUF5691 domain-containing protein [Haliangiales bacterium]|nr:DUF5691 domain-containing protein [Haliangiales bacterium]